MKHLQRIEGAHCFDTSHKYKVNEIFWSIQGEGAHAGRSAVFIRLQGCPVCCPWCDSKLTWYNAGTTLTVAEIDAEVASLPMSDLVVVTGGEPLIQDLDQLFLWARARLFSRELHVETSGAYSFPGQLRPDWTTVSPKAAAGWAVTDDVLLTASELKYVVDETFLAYPQVVIDHQDQYRTLNPGGHIPVTVMPEGSPPRPEMVEHAIAFVRRHPGVRFSPRLQYAYPTIAEAEGLNNKIITKEQAREAARRR